MKIEKCVSLDPLSFLYLEYPNSEGIWDIGFEGKGGVKRKGKRLGENDTNLAWFCHKFTCAKYRFLSHNSVPFNN